MYEQRNNFVAHIGQECVHIRVFNHTHVWITPFKLNGKVVYDATKSGNWGTLQHIGSLRPRLRVAARRAIRKYYKRKTQQS